ncbi:conserved Plasmodium protein, unknown function [Plasmodium ovale curtisi]|uniref:Uncharacterized protein n=1 Tax=Plasmodium ovale curtisi TaxID=864141 RepID=A0A1A8VY46_PLAOA|nr:conserved Plasmodium protein, unknown function [Plasmodium ovale curtisi]
MKPSILFFVALLRVCFSFITKNNDLFFYTNKTLVIPRQKKKKILFRVNSNENNSSCVNQNEIYEGDIYDHVRKEQVEKQEHYEEEERKGRKFLNALKEDDYNYLYFYHIYKKVNMIKKEKYIYNPTKYESVRSYIKRELKDCLDINTTSYIFKISEYYAKDILETSVYVSEIVNILSFFTFNSSCNIQSAKNGTNERTNGAVELVDGVYPVDEHNVNTKYPPGEQDSYAFDKKNISDIRDMPQYLINEDKNEKVNFSNSYNPNLYDEENIKMVKENFIGKMGNKLEMTKGQYDIHYNVGTNRDKINNSQQNYEQNQLYTTNERDIKKKISRIIKRDEKYKSFCFYFYRLVDAISGLFCCIGKRRKRDDIFTFLKNKKLTEKIKNYHLDNVKFSVPFMIYIIRLTKYKDAYFLCSLKRLKQYNVEDIKHIFVNCMHDNLLDISYLKNMEYEYITKEKKKKELVNPLIFNINKISNDNKKNLCMNTCSISSKHIEHSHLTKLEKEYNHLVKKYSKVVKVRKDANFSEGDLKDIINDLLNKNVFSKKGKAKMGKNKRGKKDHSLFPVDIYEVEEDRLREVLRKRYAHVYGDIADVESSREGSSHEGSSHEGSSRTISGKLDNLIRKMNNLLDSYGIYINVHLKSDDKGNNEQEETGTPREESDIKKKENGDTLEEIRGNVGQISRTVDLSKVSLSEIKKYISAKREREIEMVRNHSGERKQEKEKLKETGVEAEKQSQEEVEVRRDNDVFKYFDITQKQDSITFEVCNTILENEANLTRGQESDYTLGLVNNYALNQVDDYELDEVINKLEEMDIQKGEGVEGVEVEKDEEMDNKLGGEMDGVMDDEMDNKLGGEMDGVMDDEMDNKLDNKLGGEMDDQMDDKMDDEMDDEMECKMDDDADRRRRKEKINKEGAEMKKLKLHLDLMEKKKGKYSFENIYAKTFEEKIELLLAILERESRKKIIVCTDESERELIKMKCKLANVQYEYLMSSIKSIKHFLLKESNCKTSCFIFTNEIEDTLQLRKIFGALSERTDDNDINFYHFEKNVQKCAVFKKLFFAIINEEDSYLVHLRRGKKDSHKDSVKSNDSGSGKKVGKRGNDPVFVPFHKRREKRKLSKSEENWLSFRRRTLKKIDEMKKKAELIKKRKMEKRDRKIKRVVAKLKSKRQAVSRGR